MTWLYNSSGGSILTAVLFHTSVNVVGYVLPFGAGITVLLVLLLVGCGAIMLYPRPFLRTSEEPQDSVTDIADADVETIGEESSDEKTEREIRVTRANDAIETPGHGGEAADAYGVGGVVREDEGTWESPTEAIRDAFENARRGRLPDTRGGRAVMLMIGVAMIGGGWLVVRRFSSSR
jgi:hypothetical protein